MSDISEIYCTHRHFPVSDTYRIGLTWLEFGYSEDNLLFRIMRVGIDGTSYTQYSQDL